MPILKIIIHSVRYQKFKQQMALGE